MQLLRHHPVLPLQQQAWAGTALQRLLPLLLLLLLPHGPGPPHAHEGAGQRSAWLHEWWQQLQLPLLQAGHQGRGRWVHLQTTALQAPPQPLLLLLLQGCPPPALLPQLPALRRSLRPCCRGGTLSHKGGHSARAGASFEP